MDKDINRHDLGTWAFLRPGWWVLHLIATAVIVWLAVQLFVY